MSLQAGLEIGDGLGGDAKVDGAHAAGADGGAPLGVIEKDDPGWRGAEMVTGQLEDALAEGSTSKRLWQASPKRQWATSSANVTNPG